MEIISLLVKPRQQCLLKKKSHKELQYLSKHPGSHFCSFITEHCLAEKAQMTSGVF